jgi:hypothetical protein
VGRVELRYVARAGLLPELSRQTYDSLYKALREAILNALDAEASRVDLDFSKIDASERLVVEDDGSGMSTRQFCEGFMSLGGSLKFGDSTRFGRIGIGSLALLQYAEAATIETKQAGVDTATRARIEHSWLFHRDERTIDLGDLDAGVAEEYTYEGDSGDHFTRVILEGVNSEVQEVGRDPIRFYGLLESLRRVLPLGWQNTRLTEALTRVSPSLVDVLKKHTDEWSASVVAHSSWERGIRLNRRSFGDDQAEAEEWSGAPAPILKRLRVVDGAKSREIAIAGFLLSQARAHTAWSGVTARVQNVAVEEHTFFDVSADPGFRKYITGEIWLLGEVDRERLINIDRSSFNRESCDYKAIQRYMSRAILDFKTSNVQRPQQQKVEARRLLENHIQVVRSLEAVAQRAAEFAPWDRAGLPSSERRANLKKTRSIRQQLKAAGARVARDRKRSPDDLGYRLEVNADGARVCAMIGPRLDDPYVLANGSKYSLTFAEGRPSDPPIVIRNRPRNITFNLAHPAHGGSNTTAKFQLSFALELAYLLDETGAPDGAAVYQRMVALMEAL